MLLAFAEKLYNQKSSPASANERGTLSEIAWTPTSPVYGTVEGQPVTIIGMGNMLGFSPVAFCTDGNDGVWLPTAKIRFTDPRLRPLGKSAPTSPALTEGTPAATRKRRGRPHRATTTATA